MQGYGLDLSSYKEVKARATEICETLENGSMLCDEACPRSACSIRPPDSGPLFEAVLPGRTEQHFPWRNIGSPGATPKTMEAVNSDADEPYQIAHWPTPFQPIVLGGVPLNQLAKGAAPRPPAVHLLQLARAALPQPRLDHPPPQSLVAQLDAMPLGQLLAREGWPEVVPIRLLQNLQRPDLHFSRYLAVGCSPPQPVHHHSVALLLHPLQQLAYPSVTDADFRGRLALADSFVPSPL